MAKIILLLLVSLTLTGCFTNVCKDGKMATYKRYNIVLPDRPELTVNQLNKDSSIGESVRAYETDLTNLIEYSLQLENIINPIANAEDGYSVEPIENIQK